MGAGASVLLVFCFRRKAIKRVAKKAICIKARTKKVISINSKAQKLSLQDKELIYASACNECVFLM